MWELGPKEQQQLGHFNSKVLVLTTWKNRVFLESCYLESLHVWTQISWPAAELYSRNVVRIQSLEGPPNTQWTGSEIEKNIAGHCNASKCTSFWHYVCQCGWTLVCFFPCWFSYIFSLFDISNVAPCWPFGLWMYLCKLKELQASGQVWCPVSLLCIMTGKTISLSWKASPLWLASPCHIHDENSFTS